MQFKQAMVPVGSIFDAQSGVCFTDTTETIKKALNKSEIERYGRAMLKVQQGQGLNRRDLAVLDKIDQATLDQHGMCLKDSVVTKARIKACKKHGLKFVDRDGLVEHMNMFMPASHQEDSVATYLDGIAQSFIEIMGEEIGEILYFIVHKLNSNKLLDLSDLQFISKMEEIATEQLGFSMLTDDLVEAVDLASKNCGVYFKNLQRVH